MARRQRAGSAFADGAVPCCRFPTVSPRAASRSCLPRDLRQERHATDPSPVHGATVGARAALSACSKSPSTPRRRGERSSGGGARLPPHSADAADRGHACLCLGRAGRCSRVRAVRAGTPTGRPCPRVRCAPRRRGDVHRGRPCSSDMPAPKPPAWPLSRRRRSTASRRTSPLALDSPKVVHCAPRLDRRLEPAGGVRRRRPDAPGPALVGPRSYRLGS